MLGIGIIGCGKIAQVRHIPEYDANPDVKICGFYDLNFGRAQKLAQRYSAKAYTSYEELLGDPNIDAVSVCVANTAHAEITISALKSKKHVLCEKPMATTLEDCKEMVRAADENGKYLMIAQNQRLTGAHKLAKELIAKGMIGKIISFRTTFGHGGPESWSIDSSVNTWFFDPKRAAMGAMADLGVHKTDLIQYLTGQVIVETTAKIETIDKRDEDGNLIKVDDNAVCIYRLENGALGSMTASWTFYGKEDNSTVIYGSEGIMRIYENPEYAIVIDQKNGQQILYKVDQIQTNDNQTSSGVIDAFVNGILYDSDQIISGKDVLKAMRVVFANLESASSGKAIRINE